MMIRRQPHATPRPTRWRWAGIGAALLATSLLAACQGGAPANPGLVWTTAELGQVFDLSELGRSLTIDPESSTLLLDGRALPPDVLEAFPHLTMGRSYNLLRLSQETLDAIAGEARLALVHASPSELHAYLAAFGLTIADVRAAWGSDGELTLAGIYQVAASLDAQPAAIGTATDPGQRLLDALGIVP